MNTTALAVIQPEELDTIQRTGKLLAASGYFDGKGDSVQAIAMMATKIMAGREMGFGPFASVNGVHIISGKPTIGANLMASAVKSSGHYDYRVKTMTNTECTLEFFERADGKRESLGVSEFTMKDAQDAGVLNNPVWKKFPRNMLFARALSNGVRWYCPDVFSGNTVYVPEELGAEVDGDGNVVDTTYTVQKQPQPAPMQPQRNVETDVIFEKSEDNSPTDEELAIMGEWRNPGDAQAWAVEVGACTNEFEARNSFKKVVEANGGKLTNENIAAVYLAYVRKQLNKLQQPQAA